MEETKGKIKSNEDVINQFWKDISAIRGKSSIETRPDAATREIADLNKEIDKLEANGKKLRTELLQMEGESRPSP